MANIKFSPEAITDIEQLKIYISEELNSEKAAANTVQKIVKQIRRLEAFPLSGAPLSAIIDFNTDYRYILCGNHTAFYRYTKDTVYVVRVIYGRRDFMRILFGEVDN